MPVESSLFVICSAVYATLAALIAIQARQRTTFLLAGACLVTSGWAGAAAVWPEADLDGIAGAADLARALTWYGFILHLYSRSAAGPYLRAFTAVAVVALALGVLATTQIYLGQPHPI